MTFTCAISVRTRVESTELFVRVTFSLKDKWESWIECDLGFNSQWVCLGKLSYLPISKFPQDRQLTSKFWNILVKCVIDEIAGQGWWQFNIEQTG